MELQAVEEAKGQLALVQHHLDELARSLPSTAAAAADAIKHGSPEQTARKVADLQWEVAVAKKELSIADR